MCMYLYDNEPAVSMHMYEINEHAVCVSICMTINKYAVCYIYDNEHAAYGCILCSGEVPVTLYCVSI